VWRPPPPLRPHCAGAEHADAGRQSTVTGPLKNFARWSPAQRQPRPGAVGPLPHLTTEDCPRENSGRHRPPFSNLAPSNPPPTTSSELGERPRPVPASSLGLGAPPAWPRRRGARGWAGASAALGSAKVRRPAAPFVPRRRGGPPLAADGEHARTRDPVFTIKRAPRWCELMADGAADPLRERVRLFFDGESAGTSGGHEHVPRLFLRAKARTFSRPRAAATGACGTFPLAPGGRATRTNVAAWPRPPNCRKERAE